VTRQSLEFLAKGVFQEAFGVRLFSESPPARAYLRERLRERTISLQPRAPRE
jgi:hypothetical protein